MLQQGAFLHKISTLSSFQLIMSILDDFTIVIYISSSKLICFFDICHTDTGIASEKEWGINLLDEKVSESGQNEDGTTWYRESGEELGEEGFRCRWAKMGGKSHDGKSEWNETVSFFIFYFFLCMLYTLHISINCK